MEDKTVQNNIKLIIGLCNPGAKYQDTRHNVGANLVRQFAQERHVNFLPESKFKGLHARVTIQGGDVCHLLLPSTYMNNSGQAVRAIINFYKLPIESMLIVHDELDLACGNARLKLGGGHGGHNGLRDIINQLGSKNFLRLRLGISRPQHSSDVSNYVLKAPSKDEAIEIQQAIDHSIDILPYLFAGEQAKAMKQLHTRPD